MMSPSTGPLSLRTSRLIVVTMPATLKTPGSGSMTAIATVRQLSSLFRQQAAGRRCHHRRTNTKLIGAIVARACPSFLLIFLRGGARLCLSACSRDRAAVSFVTAQTERERLVHPRERRLASLFYRLPPFRKGHRKMGHPSFICDLGMHPASENSPDSRQRTA